MQPHSVEVVIMAHIVPTACPDGLSRRLLEGADMDQDNDGRFPDASPVEVRYPRNLLEELNDRSG